MTLFNVDELKKLGILVFACRGGLVEYINIITSAFILYHNTIYIVCVCLAELDLLGRGLKAVDGQVNLPPHETNYSKAFIFCCLPQCIWNYSYMNIKPLI